MNKRPYTAQEFDPEIAEAASKLTTLTKVYLMINDDALILKANKEDQEVIKKIYFAQMANIGVISNQFIFYFTTGTEFYLFKAVHEEVMKKHVKAIIYMNEECSKLHEPTKFEQFRFQDGAHDHAPFFLKDPPNYNYDSFLSKKKEEKALKAMKAMSKNQPDEAAEGKLNRSIEELSDSDDDAPPPPKKSDSKTDEKAGKAEPSKQDEKKAEPEKKDEKKGWFGLW